MSDTLDLIQQAIDENPATFKNILNELMRERVTSALEARRAEISAAVMIPGGDDEEEETPENEEGEETEDPEEEDAEEEETSEDNEEVDGEYADETDMTDGEEEETVNEGILARLKAARALSKTVKAAKEEGYPDASPSAKFKAIRRSVDGKRVTADGKPEGYKYNK